MLASLAASKTARLIATCVCPVVGAGTLTMAVPKVRDAVHKATAPREYALPKVRPAAAEPLAIADMPCVVGEPALPMGNLVLPLPGELPDGIVSPGYADRRLPRTSGGGGGGTNPPGPPGGGGTVPEPHAWLQLLIGFMLVGGSVRLARKAPTPEEEAMLDRVDALKKDVHP